MTKRIVTALFLLMLFRTTNSQSLRPSSWSDEYLSFLQVRGYLWSLSPLSRPVSAQDLKEELAKELTSPSNASAVAFERSLYLKSMLQNLAPDPESVMIGGQLDNRYEDDLQLETFHGRQRLQFGASLKPWLELYNTMVADSRLDNEAGYLGIRQNGFAGYTEQAVLRLHKDGVEFKIGRDYLRLGPGRDASLLLSDFSRPLDQMLVSYRHRFFQYTFFTASLDPTHYTVAGVSSRQSRYLSGHRLEVRPWRFLSVAVQEAILFGTVGTGYNLAFWNPFIFFHSEQLNGPDDGNTLGSLQLAIKLHRNWYLYGDLLIDDLQLEKSGPMDLEPSEVGYLAGVNWSDPFWIRGLDVFAEYTAITNRTYNALNPWEKWLHRRQPLGHFLGNDFDRLLTGLRYWPVSAWRGSVCYEHVNHGEGRIERDFDEPWLNTPVGKNYREPFPTGVVESSDRFTAELCWQPKWWLRMFGALSHTSAGNRQNLRGVKQSFWQGQVGFSVDGYTSIRLK